MMKNRMITAILVIAACRTFSGSCLALTPVEENFNAGKLDTTRWQLAQFENAKLRQIKERLNFLVTPVAHPDEDYAYLELRNNQPGYNETWQMTLDVANSSGQGDNVGVGFWIFNADNPGDVIFFEWYGNKTKRNRKCVSVSFVLGGQHVDGGFDLKDKLTTAGKLRVHFNQRTKIFTFHFGKSVKNTSGKGKKLVWTQMGTLAVNGKGGDSNLNWNMNPASGRFGIRLEGYGENRIVESGLASMDNFVLRGAD